MDRKEAIELAKTAREKIRKMEASSVRLEGALNAIERIETGMKCRVQLEINESGNRLIELTSLLPDITDYVRGQLDAIVGREYKALESFGGGKQDQWDLINLEKERIEAESLIKAPEPTMDDLLDELLEGAGQKNFIPAEVEEREPEPEYVPYESKKKKAPFGTKSVPVDDTLLKDLYVNQRKTVSQICKEQNWNSSSVYNALKRIGLYGSGRSAS